MAARTLSTATIAWFRLSGARGQRRSSSNSKISLPATEQRCDKLLAHVADRLRHGIRGNDVIGRLGGDEFLVVCPRIASATEALRVAERIASHVAKEILLGGNRVTPTVSLGVAWSSGAGEDAD